MQVKRLCDSGSWMVRQRPKFEPREPAWSLLTVGMVWFGPHLSSLDAASEGNRDAMILSFRKNNFAYIKQAAILNLQTGFLFEFPLCCLHQALTGLQLASGNAPLNRTRIRVVVRNEQDLGILDGRYPHPDPDTHRCRNSIPIHRSDP